MFQRAIKFICVAGLIKLMFHNYQCKASSRYTYEGGTGPVNWFKSFPDCGGKHQSPINIEEDKAVPATLPPLVMDNICGEPEYFNISNLQHTVGVRVKTKRCPVIYGGPLNGTYALSQFHFHWGRNDKEGSETLINNRSFPLEMHMVFYKLEYESFEKALAHKDGVTVLAILYNKVDKANPSYDAFTKHITKVKEPFTSVQLWCPPSLCDLVPKDRSTYYTYSGSLTTPPCAEVVTWIVFRATVPLSHEQIDVFRQIRYDKGKRLTHNFRYPQPLNGRVVQVIGSAGEAKKLNDNECGPTS